MTFMTTGSAEIRKDQRIMERNPNQTHILRRTSHPLRYSSSTSQRIEISSHLAHLQGGYALWCD